MALQRSYEAPQINVRNTETGPKAIPVANADTRVMLPGVYGDAQWMDKLLIKGGTELAGDLTKMADIAYSNRYLEGANAVGRVKSEEELQGNPLTRDWAVAGYRDTKGKLALADAEAQFSADLPLLREKGSDEMEAYLNERRLKLLPALEGMSREARTAVTGQLLLQDRTAQKKWTAEHTKFIITQEQQAVATGWNANLATLKADGDRVALGDLPNDVYQQQLQATVGNAFANVVNNPRMPTDVKLATVSSMAQGALAQDQVAIYEYMQNTQMADGKGNILGRLPFEDQQKLSNQYREAMGRTADQRNFGRSQATALLESQIDNDKFDGTADDIKAFTSRMVMNKAMTGEKAAGLLNKFYDKQFKNEQYTALAEAMFKGDVQTVYNAGKGLDDGMTAVEKVMSRRNIPPEQRLQMYMQMGRNGVDQGYKKAGEILGVSIRAMADAKDNAVLPQHVATFQSVMTAMNQAEADGLSNTRVRLLSGLGETDRMFAEQVMRKTSPTAQGGQGMSVTEAIQQAKQTAAQAEAMTPAMRSAQAQKNAQEVTKAIDAIEPRGALETAWTWAKQIVPGTTGANAAADLKLEPYSGMNSRDGWFSDNNTVQWYTGQVKQAMQAEAAVVMQESPYADAKSVINVSKANVAARTISTKNGPVILPRGTDLQAAFGIGPGNQAAIGAALDSMLVPTKDNSRFQISMVQGQMLAAEVDNKGQRIGQPITITGQALRDSIAHNTAKEQTKAAQIHGPGKTVENDGIAVTYNGDNTAGAPNAWMAAYRDNLVTHEGVRGKAYNDLSGNKDTAGNLIQTNGVGVSSHNPFYPKPDKEGRITSDQASESFKGASNQAAVSGMNEANKLGRRDQPTFLLMSELAYQSGTAFMTQGGKTGATYREFGTALAGQDVQAAQTAFKKTAAWYYSRDQKNPSTVTPRQQSYLNLIQQSMKG